MAINNIIGAVAGGIVGGVLGYSAAKEAARKKRKAVEKAAKMLKEANEKYSGEAANASMTNAGMREMDTLRSLTGAGSKNYDIEGGTQYSSGANAGKEITNEQSQAALTGYEMGAKNQATLNQAELQKVQNQINNDLKQADVNYNVDVANQQAVMNGISGLADLGKQVGNPFKKETETPSDENIKEPADGIDDAKLLEAIDKFKSLSKRLYELHPLLNKKR